MNELWVQKKTQQVDIILSDGSGFAGKVFLLSETLHDVLNAKGSFIPVKTTKGVLLLNLSQIVSVTIQAQLEQDELMTLGKRHDIRVMMVDGKEMEGNIFVNLPKESFRVKDFLDQSLSFLPLFQPNLIVYLNKQFILSVQDESS